MINNFDDETTDLSRKRVRGVRDEKARFSYGTVTNDDAFDILHPAAYSTWKK